MTKQMSLDFEPVTEVTDTFTLTQDQCTRIDVLRRRLGRTSQDLVTQLIGLGLRSLEYRGERYQEQKSRR